ncbi:hypothetical protein HYS95_00050 [Candidatus Daviesbacteria bacterium]|nr:hypothetical protein [Candidatus Daviesbacteria bacterium]
MESVNKSARLNQKGFVASPPIIIGGIIALIVIFFLATGSFKFSAKVDQPNQDQAATTETAVEETPTPSPVSTSNFKTFTNEGMNISFEYPEEWLIQEGSNNVTIALLKEGSTKNAEAVITAAKGPLAGAKGLQFASVADLQKVNIKKEFNVTDFTLDEKAEISGREARLLGFDGTISGNPLTGRYLTTIDEDNLYALTVVTDRDKWSKHAADLQKVLDSFRLLK